MPRKRGPHKPTKRKGGTVRRKGARQSPTVRHYKGATANLRTAGKQLRFADWKKTEVDSRETHFGDVWDTYTLPLKRNFDITPEAIEKAFGTLRNNLRDAHTRQYTMLRVRVGILVGKKKNEVKETWVHVSKRVPFGTAFESIRENVNRWLLHSGYATFNAVQVTSRRAG